MSHLRVLKIDHNPLEWPPKEISTFPVNGGSASGSLGNDSDARKVSKGEDAEEMQRWLRTLCGWIRDNPGAWFLGHERLGMSESVQLTHPLSQSVARTKPP